MFKILLADDECMSLVSTEHSFEWAKYGMEVVFRTMKPEAALNELLQHQYDVAFLDIRMPGISGLEIIKRCAEKKIGTSFILVSGFADFEYAQEAILLGVLSYCTKPINSRDSSSLLKKLYDHLEAEHCSKDSFLIQKIKSKQNEVQLYKWLGINIYSPFFYVAKLQADDPVTLCRHIHSNTMEATIFLNQREAYKIGSSDVPISKNMIEENHLRGNYCLLNNIQMISDAVYYLETAVDSDSLTLIKPDFHSEFPPKFRELLQYIEGNFTEPLDLKTMAASFSFNYTYCSELFQKYLGVSFLQYLNLLRLQKACTLLNTTAYSVEIISSSSGFCDTRSFERAFQKHYQMTPTHYRTAVGEKDNED